MQVMRQSSEAEIIAEAEKKWAGKSEENRPANLKKLAEKFRVLEISKMHTTSNHKAYMEIEKLHAVTQGFFED